MAKGKKKPARKVGARPRRLTAKDPRVAKAAVATSIAKQPAEKPTDEQLREQQQVTSGMFFAYNANLAPPYQVIVDTNFINFSIQHKLEIMKSMMDCLLGKVVPCVTDCVVGELEKMGQRYRLALRLARDPRFKRLKCSHAGTYADDCLVQRVREHKCYIVATNDKDLKSRIRKIPGVPIMYVAGHKYAIERLPGALAHVPLGKAAKLSKA